jgi:hypothetical protein
MREMGHADEGMALRIYAQVVRLDDTEKSALRALVAGDQTAFGGNRGVLSDPGMIQREAA